MSVAKFEHPDLSEHQSEIFKQLAAFRKEGQLCDVVVKSRDGTQHCAHMAVLCAASVGFKNMLLGAFREADQVQQGQPVEIPASDAVVAALLEFIYGGQPSFDLEDSMELLNLADAYHLPQLALGLEKLLYDSLDEAPVATALKILQHRQSLQELKASCEEKIAANFESCIEHDDFLNLTAGQVARILRREDLQVSREEVVVKGLFSWLKASKERAVFLGVLLQNVDLQSLSSTNLKHLRRLSASIGQHGHDVQREVDEAWQKRREGYENDSEDPSSSYSLRKRSKRHCLKYWSPYLGAAAQDYLQEVLPELQGSDFMPLHSMCCHAGDVYIVCGPFNGRGAKIMHRKSGEDVFRVVAGEGATVNGVNDLGRACLVSVAVGPTGKIFVADGENRRLLTFENGCGQVVLSDLSLQSVCCSPTGAVYVVTEDGGSVGKLVGETLQPLISRERPFRRSVFDACDLVASKGSLFCTCSSCIFRITPPDIVPVVVAKSPDDRSDLNNLHVTEGGTIYVNDRALKKLWAIEPDDATWTEVLQYPRGDPCDVMAVNGSSLWVTVMCRPGTIIGVYKLELATELEVA